MLPCDGNNITLYYNSNAQLSTELLTGKFKCYKITNYL